MTTTSAPRPLHALASSEFRALGSDVRLVVTEQDALNPARQLLAHQLAELDDACSRFRGDSELAALEHAGGAAVAVSSLLLQALGVALDAARLTGGDLDPTVGQTMRSIAYDRDFADVPEDGPPLTVTTIQPFSWADVDLDVTHGTVMVPRGCRLDLGATAKAFAADRAARTIAERMQCGVLVSLGGDIAVSGPAPDGGWVIRVQDEPGSADEPASGIWCLVTIHDGGLATSSTSVRRWRRGGATLHHIVDPRTGWSAASRWRTVSAVAPSCVLANVASTTSIIRDGGAFKWLAALGLPARLVDTAGLVHVVGGWPQDAPC